MSRRALPPRSTRGAKPVVRSQEDEQRDNDLYAKLFGQDLDDDEDFVMRQAKENQRKERTLRNLAKYSYARGYTYCFELDIFPRLPGHPSYAADPDNVFGSTYRQEGRLYRQSPLGRLINRVYFGLPYTEHEQRRGEGRTKNVCHGFLFENEDKKYQLDRTIATFKALRKHLVREEASGRLKGFGLLRKDPELDQLVRSDAKLPVKLQALGKKIQALEQRKASNVIAWYNDDELFLHHSRNQQLHDRIEILKRELYLSRVAQLHYETEAELREAIDQNQTDASVFLRKALTFYNSDHLSISQELLNSLAERYSARILSLVDGQPTVAFPLKIFHFGTPALREAVNAILAGRVQQESEANYYLAKFAWRRLFRAELPVQKERLKSEELGALGRRLVEEAKYFYKQPLPVPSPPPTIDELLNLQELGAGEGRVGVFREGEGTEVSGKELMLICVYDWLCKAIAILLPFAERHQELPQLLASDLFEKYSHGFVQATGSALLGTLKSNLDLLAQVVARTEPIMGELGSLYFQWEEKAGVGLLWRSKPGEEGWETEREEEDEDDGDGEGVVDSPSKKVKEND